jgi:predicted ATP-dependent serine protease
MWESITMSKNYEVFDIEDLMEKIGDIEWLWEPLVPKNYITILASRGGVGKSGFSLWLADKLAGEGKTILIFDAERSGSLIRKRCYEWDLPNWKKLKLVGNREPISGMIDTGSPTDVYKIQLLIKDVKPDLIILDSLTVIARLIELQERNRAATYFEQLQETASVYKTGILLLAHVNKKQNMESSLSLDSIAGSAAVSDLARSVLLLDEDGEGSDRRIITQAKLNLAAKSPPFKFRITERGIIETGFVAEEIKQKPPETFREDGTRLGKFRVMAYDLLAKGMNKKEARQILKDIGAENREHLEALKWASEKLNIKWEVDK